MLVFFSGRRLKQGSYDQFRRAWMPEDEELPEKAVAIYHARNVKDPDEVISFGIFDVDPGEIDEIRGDEAAERGRQDAMAAFVENVPLEGIYEVVEKLEP
jgi:hypothetical protein